ncbi:hypothetical protein BHM03_00002732, partial [Ensete ventricosum]
MQVLMHSKRRRLWKHFDSLQRMAILLSAQFTSQEARFIANLMTLCCYQRGHLYTWVLRRMNHWHTLLNSGYYSLVTIIVYFLVRRAFQGLCINEFSGLQFEQQHSYDIQTGEQ